MTALEKFQELPHINLQFDGMWHVTWIHCSEGDCLDDFCGSTPEEAIDKAYKWFHSKFSND